MTSSTGTSATTGTLATFESDKCQQRNRIAAKRDGVNAVPFRLLRTGEYDLAGQDSQPGLVFSRGRLPETDEDALTLINALNKGTRALTLNDIYVRYAEAANENYIRKYGMFLGDSTLMNIARDAAAGAAFMNSHRTGGLSAPAELPYGKTFAGRFERFADGTMRAMVALYMLKDVKPNGDSGPSTNDLDAMIEGGTTEKVSVGLGGGNPICDICGSDLDARDKDGRRICRHAPLTRANMSDEQVEAQKARGVEDGSASFTLHDAVMPEVSAVYAGAVPGAGFRKALAMARAGELSLAELGRARSAYSFLLSEGDLPMHEIDEIVEQTSSQVAAKLESGGFISELVTRLGKAFNLTAPQATIANAPDPAPAAPSEQNKQGQVVQLVATETPEYRELQEKLNAARAAQLETTAANFAEEMVRDCRLMPAARAEVVALYMQLGLDDEARPASLSFTNAVGEEVELGGRVALLEAMLKAMPQHDLLEEGKPAHVLFNSTAPTDEKPVDDVQTQVDLLLSKTAEGRALLAKRRQSNSQ